MQKLAKIVIITLAGVVLSLLLIETSTLLRKIFTESPSNWHKNLTSTNPQSITPTEPELFQAKGDDYFDINIPNIDFLAFTDLDSKTNTNLVFAESDSTSTIKKYQRITTETPLFKSTNDTDTSAKNIFFMLPRSYFVKVIKEVTLESGNSGYYVRYNTYEGYADKSAFSGTMSDIETSQSGIKISLSDDYGTYLRETPEISENNKTVLIEKGTSGILLIAKTYGDIPSDGTTNEWYFVEYSKGPTTTYTGYIYAERCVLDKPLTDLVLESDKPASETDGVQDALAGTSINTEANSTESVSANADFSNNKLLWIVCIVFTLPVILIFVAIIKKPRHQFADIEEDEETSIIPQSNFKFDEKISPKVISGNQKQYRFKSNNIDSLSQFVKPNISLEVSDELDSGQAIENGNLANNSYYSITKTASPQRFHIKEQAGQGILSNSQNAKTTSIENAKSETANARSNSPLFASLKSLMSEEESGEYNTLSNKKHWSLSKMIQKLTNKNKLSKKISANRDRDAYRPGVVSSDDYFEFADSFELTTPINSHYLLESNKPRTKAKRQGKKINTRH